MAKRAGFVLVGVTVLLGTLACGSSGTSSGPSPTLELTGTWNGSIVLQGGPLNARWTATQSGTNVSGPITLSGQNWSASGTMTGTQSGNQLAANVSVPAGAFTSISPTLSTCAMTGSGGLTASTSSVSGTINTTWTPACVGVVSAFATQTGQVSLSK